MEHPEIAIDGVLAEEKRAVMAAEQAFEILKTRFEGFQKGLPRLAKLVAGKEVHCRVQGEEQFLRALEDFDARDGAQSGTLQ